MSIEIKTNLSKKSRYRPEIDGLRAFAIVTVIINHFNKDILPGGYLGVDIFFVISGFVITSSLYQRPSKNFKDFIIGFYERRIKRLVPALSVFVLISSIIICFFNQEPGNSLYTGLTSLFGFSNLYLFYKSTDYFAQSTELNIFTHTWSLGVEEQFYILFPFLIWFSGFGRQTKNGSRNLFFIVGALTITSLLGFLYLYPSNQPAAYFLMPSRFWEMATGCLIFIGFHKRKSFEQLLENVPPLLVLALILGVMYLPISLATLSTISVVALTTILIACLEKGTRLYTFFTNPKVVCIGQISYSLYLWHWGVLGISRWTIGIHWWSVPFQLTLMLGLAICSYQYIETPFRKGNSFGKRLKTLVVSGGVLVTISGVLITLGKPLKGIIYLGNKQNIKHPSHSSLSRDKCPRGQKFNLNKISNCTLPSSNGKYIISVGDSQTGHLVPLLKKLHNIDGFGIYYFATNGVNFPSLIETRTNTTDSPKIFREKYTNQLKYFNHYLSQLKKGDIILLSSRYQVRWVNRPIASLQKNLKFTFYDLNNNTMNRDESFKQWKTLFDKIAERAEIKGVKIVVFNIIPTFPEYVFLGGKQWFNRLNISYVKRDYLKNHSKTINSALNSLANRYDNVEVFDAFSELCPESQDFCTPEKYSDQWHLSSEGALSFYEGLLKKLN